MSLPKISIITPTYNCLNTIEKTIESVVSQSYLKVEYIIVDALSNDGTIDIIDKYSKEFPNIVRYISEKDHGIYDAMNKGTWLATGEWVYYLGGDDYLYDRDVLKNVFAQADTSEFNLIYGNVKHGSGAVGSGEVSRKELLGMNIPHQAIFYRRIKVLEWGGYELKYKIMSDKLLNLQIFSEDISKVKYIDVIISFFASTGISSHNFDKDFISDIDEIALKYFSNHYTRKEIYEAIMYYSFLNIKRFDMIKGLIWILRTGKFNQYWRDVAYCILFRYGFRKES